MFGSILARLVAGVLGKAGAGFLDRVLTHVEKKADSETERQRIAAARAAATQAQAANVVIAGMQHKAFWVAWSIAAIPTTAWYGWGVLDSMLWNGTLLPDVAALPPQLKEYADVIFGNIFYAGAGMAGLQAIGNAIGRKR